MYKVIRYTDCSLVEYNSQVSLLVCSQAALPHNIMSSQLSDTQWYHHTSPSTGKNWQRQNTSTIFYCTMEQTKWTLTMWTAIHETDSKVGNQIIQGSNCLPKFQSKLHLTRGCQEILQKRTITAKIKLKQILTNQGSLQN